MVISKLRHFLAAFLILVQATPSPALPPVGGGSGGGPPSDATITAKVLKVEDAKAGTNAFGESAVGKRLSTGDTVRTGKRSKAEITLQDKSVIRLGQVSDVVIRPEREIELAKGRLRFDFQNPARIRAGTTVADVRGSSGTMVFEDGSLTISMTRGSLLFSATPTAAPVQINEGQAATIDRAGNVKMGAAPPPQFTDSGTGELSRHDTLGRAAFVARLIRHTPGTPVGFELRQLAARLLQDQQLTRRDRLARLAAEFIRRRMEERQPRGDIAATFRPPRRPRGNSILSGGSAGASPSHRENSFVSAASGGLPAPLPSAAQTGATQGYFGPRGDGNLFIYAADEGNGTAAARLRHFGAQGQLYYELGLTPNYQFQNSALRLDTTDAFITYRDDRLGDLTIGRQRFLKGPVQNTVFGTLLRQGGKDIQDAITWTPKFHNPAWSLDLSYVIDAFPTGVPAHQPGTQNGLLIRNSYQSRLGTLGVNATRGNFVSGWGVTLDWSVPAIPDMVDFYGEFGRDGASREIRTFGLYFPGLYERTGFDVFLEQSNLADFGIPLNNVAGRSINNEWLLRVYRQISRRVSGLMTLDRRTGDTSVGVGLVYSLRFR